MAQKTEKYYNSPSIKESEFHADTFAPYLDQTRKNTGRTYSEYYLVLLNDPSSFQTTTISSPDTYLIVL